MGGVLVRAQFLALSLLVGAILALPSMVLVDTAQAFDGNLLINGRFEHGVSGWTEYRVYASCAEGTPSAAWRFEGAWSYYAQKTLTTTPEICLLYQDVLVAPGMVYEASVVVNAVQLAADGPALVLRWLGATGTPVLNEDPSIATLSGQQTLSVVGRAPLGAVEARFGLQMSTVLPSEAYFDLADFRLDPTPAIPTV